VPLWGVEAGSSSNNVTTTEAYLHAEFYLDPSITVWPQYTNVTNRQNRQDMTGQDRKTDNGLIT